MIAPRFPTTCRNFRLCGAIAVTALLLACGPAQQSAQDPVARSTQEQDAALQAILNWLECEECVDGELVAVRDIGVAAVPPLRAALVDGPSPANVAEERHALETRFGRIAKQGVDLQASPGIVAGQYLNNYRAKYRMRAAIALGEIGGDEAQKALLTAGQNPDLREDVKTEIDKALAKLQPQAQAQPQPQGPPPSSFPLTELIVIALGAGALFAGGWAFGVWRARNIKSDR